MKAFPTKVSFYVNHETKSSHTAALVQVILKVSLGRGGRARNPMEMV